MSNHTKSSPEDRRVDHNDKGETERLRRENTELQIIIDDLRETIRMQASKLEQGSNGNSQSEDESHGQIVELQEFVHSLEENLQHMADQNRQLEITQGELRAEVERLQKAATMITNESDVQDKEIYQQDFKPQSENDVEHSKTHENTISESENQHMTEEFERVKALCTALEQEKDSLKTRIKDLQDCIERSSKTALTHGKNAKIISFMLSKASNLQVVWKIQT
jgi:chromosome segregation ATPase